MTYIGIDLGTSSIKAVLVDDLQRVLATVTRELVVSRPHTLWSEQDPRDWVVAAMDALRGLKTAEPDSFRCCACIGLSGQMHGAVLLDEHDRPLRPCILWNDGRAEAECEELEAAEPNSRAITGNISMPGFTAPKLLWVRKHEPELFRLVHRVLLPKAYLRFVLTGEAIEEMSDASGTLWLDTGSRAWSDRMLAATALDRRHMPALVEGSHAAGRLRPDLGSDLGFDTPPLFAGGGGDNAAGAIGLGAVAPRNSFLSLGTSGVLWRTTAGFEPRVDSAVHTFCHALPDRWHQMSVHLSAAASLSWWAAISGQSEAALLVELGPEPEQPSPVLFTPYLSGERTPHNDSQMRGSFAGLGHETDRRAMTQAVLEGVAFAFRDGKDALETDANPIEEVVAIGGGARSNTWLSILTDVLNLRIKRYQQAENGAAFGAARLARLAYTGEDPEIVCAPPSGKMDTFVPRPHKTAAYSERYLIWRRAAQLGQKLR